MAIYAARGLSLLAYGACAYQIYHWGFDVSDLEDLKGKIYTPVKDYVATQSQAMGLQKKLIVDMTCCKHFHFVGDSFSSRKAAVLIPEDFKVLEDRMKFRITQSIASIQTNDTVVWGSVSLIVPLFTHAVLNSRAPLEACAAGFATGLLSFTFIGRWREKVAYLTALKHCDPQVNQAYLNRLEEKMKHPSGRCLLGRFIVYLGSMSLNEKIAYSKAHLTTTR